MQKISPPVKTLSYIGAALAGLMLANTAWADSARLLWNINGHYYQRFNKTSEIAWVTAKTNCESLNGHLATITSPGEQDFIFTQLLGLNINANYHIGATRVSVDNPWRWITGETWIYEYWSNSIGATDNVRIYDFDGGWDNSASGLTNNRGYLCEWSYNTFVGSAVIPDLNGNGADEFAALHVNFKTNGHTVQIKDSLTQALLSTLTFPAGVESSKGMVVLNNMQTSNGTPEIAILIYAATSPNQSLVQIKDVKHNSTLIKSITFLDSNYRPKAISASPDINGNGADEITVLGLHQTTGKAKMEMRDGKTGAVLKTVAF